MKVDLTVIMDDLTPWYRDGRNYYFTDRWIRKFPEDAEAYYGFVPDRRHRAGDDRIKVYYTQDGELVISNCRDPKLQNKIRTYMENWYGWKRKEYIRKKTFRYPIPVLVRPHTTELNGRFYQIRGGDSVCNIEKSRLDSMTDMVYVHTYPEVIFESDTGLETLNKVYSVSRRNVTIRGNGPFSQPGNGRNTIFPGPIQIRSRHYGLLSLV